MPRAPGAFHWPIAPPWAAGPGPCHTVGAVITLAAQVARLVVSDAETRGIDTGELLRQAGVSREQLMDPAARVGDQRVKGIALSLAEQIDDPCWGLSMVDRLAGTARPPAGEKLTGFSEVQVKRWLVIDGETHLRTSADADGVLTLLADDAGEMSAAATGTPTYGTELWRHDPRTGQLTVADILPGRASSRPQQMRAYGQWLVFAMDAAVGGGCVLRYAEGKPNKHVVFAPVR